MHPVCSTMPTNLPTWCLINPTSLYSIPARPKRISTTFGIIIRPWTSKIVSDGSSLDLQKCNPRRKHTIAYAVDKNPISLTTLINPTTPPFRKSHAWKHSESLPMSILLRYVHRWVSLSFKSSASTTVLIVGDSCLPSIAYCARFLAFEKILQHTYVCMKVLRNYFKASKSLV